MLWGLVGLISGLVAAGFCTVGFAVFYFFAEVPFAYEESDYDFPLVYNRKHLEDAT